MPTNQVLLKPEELAGIVADVIPSIRNAWNLFKSRKEIRALKSSIENFLETVAVPPDENLDIGAMAQLNQDAFSMLDQLAVRLGLKEKPEASDEFKKIVFKKAIANLEAILACYDDLVECHLATVLRAKEYYEELKRSYERAMPAEISVAGPSTRARELPAFWLEEPASARQVASPKKVKPTAQEELARIKQEFSDSFFPIFSDPTKREVVSILADRQQDQFMQAFCKEYVNGKEKVLAFYQQEIDLLDQMVLDNGDPARHAVFTQLSTATLPSDVDEIFSFLTDTGMPETKRYENACLAIIFLERLKGMQDPTFKDKYVSVVNRKLETQNLHDSIDIVERVLNTTHIDSKKLDEKWNSFNNSEYRKKEYIAELCASRSFKNVKDYQSLRYLVKKYKQEKVAAHQRIAVLGVFPNQRVLNEVAQLDFDAIAKPFLVVQRDKFRKESSSAENIAFLEEKEVQFYRALEQSEVKKVALIKELNKDKSFVKAIDEKVQISKTLPGTSSFFPQVVAPDVLGSFSKMTSPVLNRVLSTERLTTFLGRANKSFAIISNFNQDGFEDFFAHISTTLEEFEALRISSEVSLGLSFTARKERALFIRELNFKKDIFLNKVKEKFNNTFNGAYLRDLSLAITAGYPQIDQAFLDNKKYHIFLGMRFNEKEAQSFINDLPASSRLVVAKYTFNELNRAEDRAQLLGLTHNPKATEFNKFLEKTGYSQYLEIYFSKGGAQGIEELSGLIDKINDLDLMARKNVSNTFHASSKKSLGEFTQSLYKMRFELQKALMLEKIKNIAHDSNLRDVLEFLEYNKKVTTVADALFAAAPALVQRNRDLFRELFSFCRRAYPTEVVARFSIMVEKLSEVDFNSLKVSLGIEGDSEARALTKAALALREDFFSLKEVEGLLGPANKKELRSAMTSANVSISNERKAQYLNQECELSIQSNDDELEFVFDICFNYTNKGFLSAYSIQELAEFKGKLDNFVAQAGLNNAVSSKSKHSAEAQKLKVAAEECLGGIEGQLSKLLRDQYADVSGQQVISQDMLTQLFVNRGLVLAVGSIPDLKLIQICVKYLKQEGVDVTNELKAFATQLKDHVIVSSGLAEDYLKDAGEFFASMDEKNNSYEFAKAFFDTSYNIEKNLGLLKAFVSEVRGRIINNPTADLDQDLLDFLAQLHAAVLNDKVGDAKVACVGLFAFVDVLKGASYVAHLLSKIDNISTVKSGFERAIKSATTAYAYADLGEFKASDDVKKYIEFCSAPDPKVWFDMQFEAAFDPVANIELGSDYSKLCGKYPIFRTMLEEKCSLDLVGNKFRPFTERELLFINSPKIYNFMLLHCSSCLKESADFIDTIGPNLIAKAATSSALPEVGCLWAEAKGTYEQLLKRLIKMDLELFNKSNDPKEKEKCFVKILERRVELNDKGLDFDLDIAKILDESIRIVLTLREKRLLARVLNCVVGQVVRSPFIQDHDKFSALLNQLGGVLDSQVIQKARDVLTCDILSRTASERSNSELPSGFLDVTSERSNSSTNSGSLLFNNPAVTPVGSPCRMSEGASSPVHSVSSVRSPSQSSIKSVTMFTAASASEDSQSAVRKVGRRYSIA